MFPEASSDAAITNKKQFPNVIRVNAPLSKLAKGAVAVMKVNIPDFKKWVDIIPAYVGVLTCDCSTPHYNDKNISSTFLLRS